MKCIAIQPKKFLSTRDGSVFGLSYSKGILFTGFDSSTRQAFCFLIAERDFNDADVKDLMTKLREEKFSQEHTTVKVISPIRHHDHLANLFSTAHWHPPKFVDSEDVFGQIYFYGENGRLRISAEQQEEVSVIFQKKIRVLVIDDSETIHELLKKIFSKAPNIQVVGAISDPLKAEEAIKSLKPDVLTVDINMGGMDGVTLLKKLFATKRMPALLVSSLSMKDGSQVLEGLAAGALDYIQKPTFEKLNEFAEEIIEKVRMAASVSMKDVQSQKFSSLASYADIDTTGLIALGASTGGTEAIVSILTQLPRKIPPILIVQHIPPGFSKAFAQRLNEMCPFEVKEAMNGEALKPGCVYIAPGGMHMKLKRVADRLAISVYDDVPVNRHKPSIDILFHSIAQFGPPEKTCGVVLTGMGSDGAKGLLAMKYAGMKTYAQDQATSVVYGMPKVALDIGAADQSLPLGDVANYIVAYLRVHGIAS